MRDTEATSKSARRGVRTVVRQAQTLVESLYGLGDGPCATEFLTTDRARLAHFAPELRETDEHLLVRQQDGELELLLFLDEELLRRLASVDGFEATVDAAGAGDIQVLLEGVSHFRYIVDRAGEGRTTCLLELELQAEIDKFFALCLALDPQRSQAVTGPLWHLQFERARFHSELTPRESSLYREANRLAARFCARLLRRHRGRGVAALLGELRAFRHLGGQPKLAAASG